MVCWRSKVVFDVPLKLSQLFSHAGLEEGMFKNNLTQSFFFSITLKRSLWGWPFHLWLFVQVSVSFVEKKLFPQVRSPGQVKRIILFFFCNRFNTTLVEINKKMSISSLVKRFCRNPAWLSIIINPRPAGGAQRAPLWFFANSSWSTGNFALKLVIPLRATISHLVSKN